MAVIFARVTVLLALGPALANRASAISVPVYLGNALQWDVRADEGDLIVYVPAEKSSGNPRAMLRFPLEVCAVGDQLETILAEMQRASEQDESERQFEGRLKQRGISESVRPTLSTTYGTFHKLRKAGRDTIWGYMARNLSRPIALAADPKMDVVIGNPPWLSYRFMSDELKMRYRDGCRDLGLWVSRDEAQLVTQTDLSGYFFARSTELYLHIGGRIAMVLPLAAMTRGQFRAFRTGRWTQTRVAFTEAWVLDNQDVAPLFRVPTCVLFARRIGVGEQLTGLPDEVTAFYGRPPRKDASVGEIGGRVRARGARAPSVVSFGAGSPYRSRFLQGATLVPRMMCYVERAPVGRLGASAAAPVVRSVRSPQEKAPWKELDIIEHAVDAECLREAYLGASIAPFRILDAPEAVVPVAGTTVLDSRRAEARSLHNTADWLRACERLWDRHSSGRLSFRERLDYQGGLRAQFPIAPIRVAYAASGVKVAAVIIRNAEAVLEHSLYWTAVQSEEEGSFLTAILNSEAARSRVEHMQSRGEQGARHFDKLFFTLPIPRFEEANELHQRLSAAGLDAAKAAAGVWIDPDTPFVAARTAIRESLKANGASGRIDGLVDELLGDAGVQDRARPIGEPVEIVGLADQAAPGG